MKTRIILVIFAVFCFGPLSCSSLSGGVANVFTGDSDPQLVGDSLPFTIKLCEILLTISPNNHGLKVMAGSLFVMYANAFVQGPAEQIPSLQWQAREEGMKRAKQMYLRGYTILNGALEKKFKGFNKASAEDGSLQALLAKCKKKDVNLLYWTVAGGLAAYSIDIFDFDLSANLPKWGLMIQRAYELDPDYGGASLDEFLVIYYASMPEMMGGSKEKAKLHFQKAIEKTKGNTVSAYVSYAQSICVPAQDYETYKDYLEKALAIDVNADPSTRLVNIIGQKKARWLLDNAYNYFSFLPIPDDY